MTGYFVQAFIYLCAAVIAVPLAKRLGLGSVLGYLIAGVIIGPAIGLVGQETATIQHFAEFGVVMMLFLVGLELEPKMLWNMRNKLIGLGGLQVSLTVIAIMIIALLFNQQWSVALTIGLIFSLSSTAIVLQTFNEKGLTKTEGARSAFSALLFQDIAVIPMLALIPLLALPELVEVTESLQQVADNHKELSLVADLPNWLAALVILGAIAAVVVGGHFVNRPLFRFVASSRLREIFTAAALMHVIGIAALMSLVGLSPALGTFLAGVVLANSEFRHELESNIEPFKGLLLGLFFITVGAGINFTIFAENWGGIIAMTFGVILLKALILYGLARLFKIGGGARWLFTLSLAQAGEFGFVLLSYSQQNDVIPNNISQILALVVALSMFLTPGLFILFDKVISPRFQQSKNEREADEIDDTGQVIIAGVGRFGQIVNRLLTANGFKTVVLDHAAGQVDVLRQINIKSFYGDATKPDLLHTAGIEESRLIVIAIDDRQRACDLVQYVKHTYPHVKILARAFDRSHAYELENMGADIIVSETYFSALELGTEALKLLGIHPFAAAQKRQYFVRTEELHKEQMFQTWKSNTEDNKYAANYRELFMALERTLGQGMQSDPDDRHDKSERAWTPPPKDYAEKIN